METCRDHGEQYDSETSHILPQKIHLSRMPPELCMVIMSDGGVLRPYKKKYSQNEQVLLKQPTATY